MNVIDRHILEVDSVELSFGCRRVLGGACVSVATGESVAIVGRNGEGKSCLMKIICGRMKCGFKSFHVDSHWRIGLSPHEVRYLPQGDFIPPRMRIGDVMDDFGVDGERFYADFPSLESLRTMRMGDMSGGERRIVGFYAVMRGDAMFVMLDEPFSQVMPVHIDAMKRIICEEKVRKGILLTDHMYRHVADTADRMYLLSGGTTRPVSGPDCLVRAGYLPQGMP